MKRSRNVAADHAPTVTVAARRTRGRPRREERRDIAETLLDATELLLQQNGFSGLTERKIATLANVSEATIPYYFGDKNGLLFAVVDRFLAFIDERLASLLDIDPKSPAASFQFARAMIEAHHTRPWIAFLMTAEQQRHSESPIWHWYARRRGPRSLIQVRDALLYHASARYGSTIKDESKATRAALSLLCVSTGMLSWHTLSQSEGIRLGDVWEDPWLQHMAEIVDFQLSRLAGDATTTVSPKHSSAKRSRKRKSK